MDRREPRSDLPTALAIMREDFIRAQQSSPVERHDFGLTLAGRPVIVRVVGSELAEAVKRPFAHLLREVPAADQATLTAELWDRRATGVSLVDRPHAPHGGPVFALAELGLRRAGLRTPDPGLCEHRHRDSLLVYDRKAARLVGSFSSAAALSLYERGRPLLAPLTLWHNDRGVPVVHAGLVALNGKGVLFAGPAGVGKSTAAVSCLLGGFSYLSDDLIGLEADDDGSFRGHSIYNSTYFDPTHLQRLPPAAPHAIASRYGDEDKLLVLLNEVLPGRIVRSAPIHAVVLPEIDEGSRTAYRSESAAKALLALAPPSLQINRNLGSAGFDKLARLAESVPAFRLRLGNDLSGIAPAVEELLQEVG